MRRRSSVRAVAAPALVLAVLAAASLAVLTPAPGRAATGITISSGGCAGGGDLYCYSPESASGTVGVPVVWSNPTTGVPHTATLCTPAACPGAPASTGGDTFDVAINSGATGTFTFHSPGIYYYYCTVHLYTAMHGSIRISAASTPPPATSPPAPPPSKPRPTPASASPQPATSVPAASSSAAAAATAAASPSSVAPTAAAGGVAGASAPATAPRSRSLAAGGGAGGFPGLALGIVLALLAGGGATGAVVWRRRR